MSVRDLIPWSRSGNRDVAAKSDQHNPFLSLHREINRIFDEAFREFDSGLPQLSKFSAFREWPHVEISETAKEIRVSAELPGLEPEEIEVLVEDGTLTIRGERRDEQSNDERQFSERYYGRFERHIPLSAEVEEARIDARFKNGVLAVVLPKDPRAQSRVKRIPITH